RGESRHQPLDLQSRLRNRRDSPQSSPGPHGGHLWRRLVGQHRQRRTPGRAVGAGAAQDAKSGTGTRRIGSGRTSDGCRPALSLTTGCRTLVRRSVAARHCPCYTAPDQPQCPEGGMQQLARSARIFSSPTVLIVTVWSVLLVVIAIGPIDYSNQPSGAVLAIVVIGISLFILAQQAGAWCFRAWFAHRAEDPWPRTDRLSLVVGISSCAGIAGIGLIALDRIVLSGVSNSAYTELLRCAPDLIDIVEIKRTPLLYAGYLLFSFGYASVVLFLLKGEQIRGWAAALAQVSILSPIGYALLYAGRMPILFVILLMMAAVLVRLAQGRRSLPEGHHLFIKMIVLVLVFGIYSSAIWASRRNFCTQMNGVVRELNQRMEKREAELAKRREQQRADIGEQASAAGREGEAYPSASPPSPGSPPAPPKSSTDVRQDAALGDAISAGDISRMIAAAEPAPKNGGRDAVTTLLLTMDQAWHTKPSGYVISAIKSGHFSPGAAVTVLSTYFYLTHGVRILDMTW